MFAGALEFSFIPHARCPEYADRLGIYTLADAWNCVKEIREDPGDGEWLHADILGVIADVCARTFALMGNCRFPVYITPATTRGRFDTWKLINERRLERQEGRLPITSGVMSDLQPTRELVWETEERNQDRARRRYLRA